MSRREAENNEKWGCKNHPPFSPENGLSYHGSGANWDFYSEKPSYARSACSNDESNAHNFIKNST
jgi:hypothetical protein